MLSPDPLNHIELLLAEPLGAVAPAARANIRDEGLLPLGQVGRPEHGVELLQFLRDGFHVNSSPMALRAALALEIDMDHAFFPLRFASRVRTAFNARARRCLGVMFAADAFPPCAPHVRKRSNTAFDNFSMRYRI